MLGMHVSDDINANGVMRLSINARAADAPPTAPLIAQEANSWTFTTLASAINIGLQVLETPMGRRVLQQLGHRVVEGWHSTDMHQFGGDVRYMGFYVDHFLKAMRNDFPGVMVKKLGNGNIDTIAEASRFPPESCQWDGDLSNHRPKLAGGISYQYSRVADMAEAASRMMPAGSAHTTETRRMSERHKNFQFMFGCATAHELCHAFVGYLAQGDSEDMSRYTPPNVTYLNYHQAGANANADDYAGEDWIETGESGRWLEKQLFGGSLEFYRDPNDDDGQAGIPYIVDEREVSWRIDPQCIHRLVAEPRQFEFPFAVIGPGLLEHQRQVRGPRRMGWGLQNDTQPGRRLLMRARLESRNLLTYNVSGDELRRIPLHPQRLRAVQLVNA